ncbi:MAG: thiamine-monophosphate kinase [Phycisphaerales bacterium]|nr:thiamine-monophosphate kinase [Phycisphaerales bacterium]
MRESELLEHIYRRSEGLAGASPDLVVGPGDDCAVLRQPGGGLLLLTVDQLLGGVHYKPGTPVDRVARKAVARSVSDIAAMGGEPRWALATAMLPKDYPEADELFDRMAYWASRWGCPLIGGDIGSGPGELLLTVTIGGEAHPDRGPVLRSGAKPGDRLFVSGSLGGSLQSEHHLLFEPRVALGTKLCDTLGRDLHAMIDLSDGLGRDGARLAKASGVRLVIDAERIPRRDGVTSWRNAAGDGEDYELLVAIAPGREAPEGLIEIGEAAEGSPRCEIVDSGEKIDAGEMGWDH